MKKVTAALLIHEGKILIAQRPAGDKLAGKWEFPGGKIEEDETPEECLAREMFEEFNITVEVGEYFADSVYEYPGGAIQLMAFWCKWTGGEITAAVHDAFVWTKGSDLLSYDFAPADVPLVKKLTAETKGSYQ